MQTISFPANTVASAVHHGVRELLENALEQALLIVNTTGEVLFATRKTRAILRAFFAQLSDNLIPNEIRTWLVKGDTNRPLVIRHPKKGEIEICNFHLSPSENLSLMRIEHRLVRQGPKALLTLGLTARESEVLFGQLKVHRPVLVKLPRSPYTSPGTVKKHAANLYAKLGVPTRTSAARCALSILLADA